MQIATTPSLTATKEEIDAYLYAYSERRIKDAERIGASYVRLRKSIDTLIRNGGKRLRPHLVLTIFRAYAPEKELASILPAAAAQELIHLAMLIHDDIIDRDLVRYGAPNIAGEYEAYYAAHATQPFDHRHTALSAALLAGDALIADAHQILRKTQQPPHLVQQAEDILSQSIFDVIGGELLDTEGTILTKDAASPLTIAEHKTSSYSFVGPLTTGAVLADAPEADVMLLSRLGKHLGIGYQLTDDLLGTFGDEQKTGKSASGDIKEGKRTFLIEEFTRLGSESQQADFFAIFHRDNTTDAEIARARALLYESGAVKAVEDHIGIHKQHCDAIIEGLSVADEYKQALHTFVSACLKRES